MFILTVENMREFGFLFNGFFIENFQFQRIELKCKKYLNKTKIHNPKAKILQQQNNTKFMLNKAFV